jgi:hypothetical protein
MILYLSSVADPGCLSRIPNLGSRAQKQQQKRGVKKNCCSTVPFFIATNSHRIENYKFSELLKKKIWASLQIIVELFTQKIVTKLS